MAKYCADCTHYNLKKPKKEGVLGICKCMKEKDKKKEYKLACTDRCDKFEEAYSRGWYEREKLYDEGKKIYSSERTGQMPWFTALVLAIIAGIAKLFGII